MFEVGNLRRNFKHLWTFPNNGLVKFNCLIKNIWPYRLKNNNIMFIIVKSMGETNKLVNFVAGVASFLLMLVA